MFEGTVGDPAVVGDAEPDGAVVGEGVALGGAEIVGSVVIVGARVGNAEIDGCDVVGELDGGSSGSGGSGDTTPSVGDIVELVGERDPVGDDDGERVLGCADTDGLGASVGVALVLGDATGFMLGDTD